MELDAMISEICRKVQERVAELEKEEAAGAAAPEAVSVPASDNNRPGLLILSQDHGTRCHPMLESKKLGEYYRVDCALLKEDCDVASYEGVIAFTLTNESLGKIANGIFDNDYTRRFGTALLLGKRIFIAEEEVELYRYKDTASAGYYSRLEENLTFLQQNGVTIVPLDQLEAAVLGEAVSTETAAAPKKEDPVAENEQPADGKTMKLAKRIITERDVISAREEKVSCIQVGKKAILSDLAREYAKKYGIRIVREESASDGKGARA